MHYYAVVIMPKGKRVTKARVDQLMRRYDENLEVEEHAVDCFECDGGALADYAEEPCPSCGGDGTVRSRSNPDGKWDWYVIGGRWNGVLDDMPEENAYQDKTKKAQGRVADIILDTDKYPHTIVTPDGGWHERKWLKTHDEPRGEWHEREWRKDPEEPDASWHDRACKLLWEHAECWCAVVDYHA